MTAPCDSRLAPSFLPTTAVLEMTERCNHRCLFCSCPWEARPTRFVSGPELSVEQWKRTIRRLCELGVTDLSFSGGEALLKEGILDIIRFASQCRSEHIRTENQQLVSENKHPQLFLISNGTSVTREILGFLRDARVHLSMSLPGLTTLGWHTGVGDPDVILDKFRMARELGMTTTVNITVTRRNLFELYHTISAAFLAGADRLLLNRILPGGRGLLHMKELALSASEIREMLRVAEDALEDAGREGHVGTELPKSLVDFSKNKRLTVSSKCAAAVGFFVVGSDGFTRVCNHSPVRLVPVQQISRLKTHPYWRQFALKEHLPQPCLACSFADQCDGGCREAAHILHGKPDAPDRSCPFCVTGIHRVP